jgi:hypothetical protein
MWRHQSDLKIAYFSKSDCHTVALYRSSLLITKKYPELGLAQLDLPERAKVDNDWQIA